MPKYTFSRISCQQQGNGGNGWSDDGIAKYNDIYDLVESDRQLRGNTFNQELLKVHQRRRQMNKKKTVQNMDNPKKQRPCDDLRSSQEFECGLAMTQL